MKSIAWLKQWCLTAFEAASSAPFYRRISERKPGEAVAHLALLAVFLWVLPASIFFFLGMRHGVAAIGEGLRTRVPASARFTLKDGKLTDNLAEPLVIREQGFTLIINTATSTLALEEGEDGVAVNTTGLVQQSGGRHEDVSFSSAPSFDVTRTEMEDALARWAPIALFFGSLFALFAVFTVFTLGFMASAALHGLALWLIFKLWKRPRKYAYCFTAAAYAATLPIAMQAALNVADVSLGPVPSLLYWAAIAWIAFDAIKRSPAPVVTAPEPKK